MIHEDGRLPDLPSLQKTRHHFAGVYQMGEV